jgi:hypothetical protein
MAEKRIASSSKPSDTELRVFWERLNKRITVWEKELGYTCPAEKPGTVTAKKRR